MTNKQPTRVRLWQELTSDEAANLDPRTSIAVLPVAAIEQHGPHLPLATDALICEGLLAALRERRFSTAQPLLLPLQPIGHSLEHANFAGSLSLGAETLLAAWLEIGRGIARAGLRKLMILNTHGGNAALLQLAALRLRSECGLLVARANSFALGAPAGLFDEAELRLGIHGGEVETSLILHLRPDLVRRDALADFQGLAHAADREGRMLGPARPVGIGWLAEDLHSQGVSGDARNADAKRGAQLLAHIADALARTLDELAGTSPPATPFNPAATGPSR